MVGVSRTRGWTGTCQAGVPHLCLPQPRAQVGGYQKGREGAMARESTEMIPKEHPRPATDTEIPVALQWSDSPWSWVSPRL